MSLLIWILVALAAIPAVMSLWNVSLLRPPPRITDALRPDSVSVLIPARNEADNIGAALDSVIASAGDADVEILVLDDDSTDETAAIVRARAAADARVRLLSGGPVASGLWGKPVACARLARAARGRVLLFMDADVRLQGDAIGRIVAGLDQSGAAMLSGIPKQITHTTGERLIVPLIHFVLVGFLPMFAMRRSASPGFAAACGQLLAVRRDAYDNVGGHRAVADRVHDAMALARQFRHRGYLTDLADFTTIAHCRMYGNWREVVAGFAKNAHEGLGSPGGIVPWTVLLFGGQSAWLLALPWALSSAAGLAAVATTALLVMGTRMRLAMRFETDMKAVLLHPVGVAALVAIQWYALLRRMLGRPVAWKSRLVGG
jgi:cellulose synthase/poly-beta-1,6-N-acetylglucosamine synthase-like glycosyltransferase